MLQKKNVVVIGAGFGGLASAALLAKKGFSVTLIEKNNCLGGRAQSYSDKGFFFDMGPSWYLMPEVFENYFSLFNKKTTDYYSLKQLDPAYRVFFEKEGKLDIPAKKKEVMKVFESIEQGAGKKLEKYISSAEFKYTTAMKEFLYKDYTSIFDFFTPKLILAGLQLQLFDTLDGFVSKQFKDHRLRKLLEYSTVFLGGSPENTPALYSLMSHVDLNVGVYYPKKGIFEVVKALESLCIDQGVKIIKNDAVISIDTKNQKATQVKTKKNKTIPADVVLVNADYAFSEKTLLSAKSISYSNSYWEKKIIGPSALIFYLGVNKKIKNLKHHNLFVAHNWNNHFNSIFHSHSWPKKPSYYVSCPSKSDPTVAPKEKENLFFLVPVSAGLNDTPNIREEMLQQVITDFESRIGESIQKDIIVKRVFAHTDFTKEYNAYKGTALGLAHTLWQTAIFRPQNKSKKINNLYYTGSYTHPGIGVPMVLIAAQVVSEKIEKETREDI